MNTTHLRSTVAAAFALALALADSAQADVIDFDHVQSSPDAPFLPAIGHNDQFESNGFWFVGHSASLFAQPGDLVGALIDGKDAVNTCFGFYCPINNPTTFYGALDDGVLGFGRTDGASFKVRNLQASFIAPDIDWYTPLTTLLMHFQGTQVGGELVSVDVALPRGLFGEYKFRSYRLPTAFASTEFTQIAVYGLACDAVRACTSFNSNRAQFAIDNITVDVSPVPEPAGWALMALGLVAVAGAARRRQAA